jgi:hypothetical protein
VSQWQPIWRVKINGVEVTESVLSNLTISSGRNNIYEQPYAGYCYLQIVKFDSASDTYGVTQTISIEVKDSTDTFIPIFGGSITDISQEIAQVGSIMNAQRINIIATGALSKLARTTTLGVLSKDYDGDQIWEILNGILLNQWQEVSPAATWGGYDPTVTWATAENAGLGEIDRPGDYELDSRSSNEINALQLVQELATSGLGYVYESPTGAISYADSTHRNTYLSTNGYVELTANHALGVGITTTTRIGDVRNKITLAFKSGQTQETTDSDPTSIALFGEQSQIIETTIDKLVDAESQAAFYLSLRAYPRANFETIRYELTNSELDDSDRDSLINIFMGMPIRISDLPTNMGSIFQGFVEGWTFQANYNQLTVSLNASPLAFSLQAARWNSVNPAETWSSVSGTLDWENATIVA